VFETNIVVVGNVLTAPEWRRTSSQALVANFRVASTARRFDRDSGRWVDGSHLRVRVNCWRRLAEGVGASITVGDPVVVVGRLYTRDWTDGEGNLRTSYEMEAQAVGHDLARGKGKFFRGRPTMGTSETDGPDASGQVRGEPAELLAEQEVPARYGEGIPDEEEPTFVEGRPAGLDPVAALIGLAAAPRSAAGDDDAAASGDDLSPVESESAEAGPEKGSEQSPENGSEQGPENGSEQGPEDGPEGGPEDGSALEIEVEALGSGTPVRRRPRRAPKREPVPA
jgi:single-strand DNA-binding protein